MKKVLPIIACALTLLTPVVSSAHEPGERCTTNVNYSRVWRVDDTIRTGRCDDVINVGGIVLESVLHTGRGSDRIRVNELLRSTVMAGMGADTISVETTAYDTDIVTGNGFDTVIIGGDVTRLNLNTGARADRVYIGGRQYEGNLLTGAGNDTLEIIGVNFVRGVIDMGAGQDVLMLGGASSEYQVAYEDGSYKINDVHTTTVFNVETIIFADGTVMQEGVLIQPSEP